MKNSELLEVLKALDIPIAYHKFEEVDAPDLPYVVYFQTGDNNFGADNTVYLSDNDYAVELYTETKNFELEQRLEQLFIDNDIYFEKIGDARIKDEDMIVVIYYV